MQVFEHPKICDRVLSTRVADLAWQAVRMASAWLLLLGGKNAIAQITPDNSLGAESSIVTPIDALRDRIEGGAIRGSNLFHSFRDFNISEGAAAFFSHPAGIENILARVTGGNVSNILGTLGVLGDANLFLLNPNGILFGENAQLNLNGSFVATSATQINLADGTQFSASANATPLLTMSVPIGLQFGATPGRIVNQSQFRDTNNIPVGLQVPPGETLAIIGGNLEISGGLLTATGGQIELASVGSNSLVRLNQRENNWFFGYDQVSNFADIQLSQTALIDASGDRGGNIQVIGRNISVIDGSRIVTNTQGANNGGTLNVNASESVQLVGTSADGEFLSSLVNAVEPQATGTGGNLIIDSPRLLVRDGAQVLSATFGAGDGGNLTVRSRSIELIGTSADGSSISGLLATAEPSSSGNSGNLSIETERLQAREGAQVAVTTFSSGNAGTLRVNATDIELLGTTADGRFPSGLFAGANRGTSGQGGNLMITTQRLTIRNGAEAIASTLGTGDAGDLLVRATELIELTGRAPGFPGGLLAVSGLQGVLSPEELQGVTGNGGNLTVETGRLIVQDGSIVTVSADGVGDAGTLSIVADAITLDNGGAIAARTATGFGGNLQARSQDLILLRRGSQISTTAGSAGGAGSGGNIHLETDVLVGLENSDISANAFAGEGGAVAIATQGLFGLQTRSRAELQTLLGTEDLTLFDPQQLLSNDITAISQTNPQLSGTVEINRPDVDPSQGLLELPSGVVDGEGLITAGCPAGDRQSEFFFTGRGGLPPTPDESLSGEALTIDLVKPAIAEQGRIQQRGSVSVANAIAAEDVIEAQGWIMNDVGEIVLAVEVPRQFRFSGNVSVGCMAQ